MCVQQDRLVTGSVQKPNTMVVFGPMIDSPTAHPDTVLTMLVNLETALNSFGMQYTNITVDLQLHQTACLVKWNDPLRWTNVIPHPGMMHTLTSFLGHMYNEAGEEQKPLGEVDGEETNKHKEEGERRRRLDEADRKKIAVQLEKYSRQTQ